jgi:hypothetical protein
MMPGGHPEGGKKNKKLIIVLYCHLNFMYSKAKAVGSIGLTPSPMDSLRAYALVLSMQLSRNISHVQV